MIIIIPTASFAADVYVKIGGTRTSGKSTTGDWSNANCYPDIVTHGFPAMSAGDTMTIDDGTYTGTANHAKQDTATPPNGTSKANMTVIRARNIPCQDGYSCSSALKVTWGESTDNGDYSTSGLGMNGPVNSGAKSYIKFYGLRMYNASLYTDWSYIYFKQCALIGSMTGNTMSFSTDSPYLLMEDSVVMGSGRYQTMSHLGEEGYLHNVFRRVVARKDYSNGSNQATMPMGIFTSYYTLDDAYLNCIAIDSDQPAYYANESIEYGGSFFHGMGATGLTIKGSISINVAMNAITLGTHSGTNTITDFSAVNNAGGLAVSHGSANRATVYNVGTDLFSGWKTGQIATFSGSENDAFATVGGAFSVTNSIARTAQGYAGNGDVGTLTGSYWDYYGTGGNSNVTPSDSITTDPLTHGLLYPVRIETGSSLATAGSGGSQIGANILKRIGHDGDFNGDTGWNTETTTDLWPWPYEDWVKAELAAMPSTLGGLSMPSPTRGVAAAGNDAYGQPITLTRYIWQSLGNQIPADIYGSTAVVSKLQGGGKLTGGTIR
jgi:hypothetical protein